MTLREEIIVPILAWTAMTGTTRPCASTSSPCSTNYASNRQRGRIDSLLSITFPQAPRVLVVAGLRSLGPAPGAGRILLLATLVNSVGNGLFLAGSALFFTRSVGLSATEVGVGLTLAGVVGLLASVPFGHIADRRGPKEVYLALLTAQAVSTTLFVLVHSFMLFAVVALLYSSSEQAVAAVRGALIAGVGGPEGRVRIRAYFRSVTNVGVSLGALLAGLALHADTYAAYAALLLGDAGTFILCALILLRLPRVPPIPRPAKGSPWTGLRDRPFLAVTALNGIMSLQYGVLTFALPLWIVGHTTAPRWLVSGCLFTNTLLVTLLQVRFSRGTERVAVAARAMRRGGLVFLASCGLLSAATGAPVALAIGLLVTGVVLHTVGELWSSAGAFGLAFELAPDHAQGQYQGVFSLGVGGSIALAPALLSALCLDWGRPGWIVLGVLFATSGAAMPTVARWAQRSRSTG